MTDILPIVYRDDDYLAINKPAGLLVHRTPLARDATEFAVDMLQEQIDQKVYSLHRIDRKTSGVLLFGLHRPIAQASQELFAQQRIKKRYLAIVRGRFPAAMIHERELKDDNGHLKSAVTEFSCISQCQMDIATAKFPTSRYSLIEAKPRTGRFHQIRRHLNRLNHPILADRPHGCSEQNRLMLKHFQLNQMMLHAIEMKFIHPLTNVPIEITAELPSEFIRMMKELNLSISDNGIVL